MLFGTQSVVCLACQSKRGEQDVLRGQVFMVYHSMHCPKGKEAT